MRNNSILPAFLYNSKYDIVFLGNEDLKMTFKALVWDADGVLIQSKYLFSERLAQEYGMETKKMLPFFLGPFRDCTIGKADLKEELAQVLPVWGWKGTVDDLLIFWFRKGTEFDTSILNLVKKIRDSGVLSYMATDQERYRGEYIRHKLEGTYLDKVFISAEIGCRKNLGLFWNHLYKSISDDTRISEPIRREEILYIDDDEDNIETARNAGFATYPYDGDFSALTYYLIQHVPIIKTGGGSDNEL